MSFKFQITEGKESKPIKLCLYAPEGFGKTTFASKAPDSLIIDTENGSLRIDCRRVQVNSYEMSIEVIKSVIENPSVCKTLVIDTMDKLETYGIQYICTKYRKSSIEDWPYGRGHVVLQELFQEFYKLLDKVTEAGINIIIIAHAKPRKFELPDQEGAYDRWELKLNKQTSPLLKEWVDCLLFGNYKTYVVTTENRTKKAQGNKRTLFTSHQPTFDAKNRFELPDEMEFDFNFVSHLFERTKPEPVKNELLIEPVIETKEPEFKPETMQEKLLKLIAANKIEVADLQKVVAKKGQYPVTTPITEYSDEFITRWIIPNFTKIVDLINKTKGDK